MYWSMEHNYTAQSFQPIISCVWVFRVSFTVFTPTHEKHEFTWLAQIERSFDINTKILELLTNKHYNGWNLFFLCLVCLLQIPFFPPLGIRESQGREEAPLYICRLPPFECHQDPKSSEGPLGFRNCQKTNPLRHHHTGTKRPNAIFKT